MKPKTLAGAALVLFAIVSLGYALINETRSAAAGDGPAPAVAQQGTVVYYLHATQRCPTCRKIEEQTQATLQEEFGAELASGALTFASLNIDEPAHQHFVEEFDLSMSTVVVAHVEDERATEWKALDEVWTLVHEPEAMREYISAEVRAYTAGAAQ